MPGSRSSCHLNEGLHLGFRFFFIHIPSLQGEMVKAVNRQRKQFRIVLDMPDGHENC